MSGASLLSLKAHRTSKKISREMGFTSAGTDGDHVGGRSGVTSDGKRSFSKELLTDRGGWDEELLDELVWTP
eukprot:CAMPEP_0197629922 /NCGR_PEP_ID=MMETSP1338-20131121/7581_1 /TAXON_ID=43686 ORGANISM="Pelagodinium beii, Strain RCC1491" /NCGR_SAMPLE_ID=MMETSP1338 /ASSEMBLY_ACC=CAM_ASM_000754 /LENGTH=71 /DNA_ID=CAMNT_0043201033 /DNA_START=329 /DNA_END=544 /DNA_ORIENTATION=-